MTALADAPSPAHFHSALSQRLRTTMAAARLSFTWFGVHKSLTAAQKAIAAESFGAEGEFLSAGKKLIDTKHPAFRAVTAIRGRVQAVWKGMTLPYPEPGVRLLRRDQIERFDSQMTDLRAELNDEVARLDAHFADLMAAAPGRDHAGRRLRRRWAAWGKRRWADGERQHLALLVRVLGPQDRGGSLPIESGHVRRDHGGALDAERLAERLGRAASRAQVRLAERTRRPACGDVRTSYPSSFSRSKSMAK